MTRLQARLAALACALPLTLFGCGGEDSPSREGESPDSGTSEPECASAADCDALPNHQGHWCSGGSCTPCTGTDQCFLVAYYGEGTECIEGRCVEQEEPCAGHEGTVGCPCFANGTCMDGLRCDGEACVEGCPAADMGTEGCPCFANGTCMEGLVCSDESVCTSGEDPCLDQEGSEGCPCRADGTCDDGLMCSEDVCVSRDCTNLEGTEGCPCDDERACDDELYCTETDRCAPCADAAGPEVGCPCPDDGCGEVLICVQATDQCRNPYSCDDLECVPHQRCEPSAAASDAFCLAECDPGWLWNADSHGCVEQTNCTCGNDDECGVRIGCQEQNRACVEEGDSAHCGDCLEGYLEEEGQCLLVRTCEQVGCVGLHRQCAPAGPHSHARCGGCLVGYEEQGGLCEAIRDASCDEDRAGSILDLCESANRHCVETASGAECGQCRRGFRDEEGSCVLYDCDFLDCYSEGRFCDPGPPAACYDCEDGQIADASADGCRPPYTCEQIGPCAADQHCVPEAPAQDAKCEANGCLAGQQWFDSVQGCRPCPICGDDPGEADHAYPELTHGAARCICETLPGYFPDPGGDMRILPCDEDGDGWVRERASVPLEAAETDPLRINTRCALRRIDAIVLEDEAGAQVRRVDDLPAGGLLLYESDVLDSQSIMEESLSQFTEGGAVTDSNRVLVPAELNPLTKRCNHQAGDFNDNKVNDFEEWQGQESSAEVPELLREFSKFAYFVELYRGWYVGPDQLEDGSGEYHIRERSRGWSIADDWAVPVVYAVEEGGPESASYWRTCTRWRDSAFESVEEPMGMDFAWLFDGEEPWIGLQHHSQFKCLLAVESELTPEEATAAPTSLTHAQMHAQSFHMSRCVAPPDLGSSTPVAGEANPSAPVLRCDSFDPSEETLPIGSVAWGAVGYLDYTDPYDQLTFPGERPNTYIRGCINECAAIPEQCPGSMNPDHPEDSPGACDGNVADFGHLLCGCNKTYGGEACSMGCPNAIYQADFDISTREGFWLCGGLLASDGEPMENEAAGYTLRGHVPAVPIERTEMVGGDYVLR